MTDLAGESLSAMDPGSRRWLRAEGLVVFLGSVLAWVNLGGAWLLFPVLLLLPDLSIAGYRWGPKAGAIAYNAVHNWALGGAVAGLGLLLNATPLLLAGVLLIGHTGLDRALGYGLKSPTSFSDTHLGRIGRRRSKAS